MLQFLSPIAWDMTVILASMYARSSGAEKLKAVLGENQTHWASRDHLALPLPSGWSSSAGVNPKAPQRTRLTIVPGKFMPVSHSLSCLVQ